MPFSIEEIKKLPKEELHQLFYQIQELVEEDLLAEDDESPEVVALLEKRYNEYITGKSESLTKEETRAFIDKQLAHFTGGR